MSIEDVTARVNAAVKPGMSSAEAEQARRAVMNTIEKESLDKTGLRSDVVTLYHGGLYHLYRFKKYTDVRLVFAPEQDIAFFGGDPDNFEYPALRSRHLLLPRLRERQAGQDRALPEVEPDGRGRRRAGLRLRPSRPAPTGSTRWPIWSSSATASSPTLLQALPLRGAAARPTASASARTPAGRRTTSSASRTAARPAWAGWPACRTPPIMSRKTGRGAEASPGRGQSDARAASSRSATAVGPRSTGRAEGVGRRSTTTATCWSSGSAFHSELFGIARTLVRAGRGDGQAQRRPAPRVPRVEPGIAQARAVLRGADLRRPRDGAAGRLAEHVWRR